jgi:hypothetical protein
VENALEDSEATLLYDVTSARTSILYSACVASARCPIRPRRHPGTDIDIQRVHDNLAIALVVP